MHTQATTRARRTIASSLALLLIAALAAACQPPERHPPGAKEDTLAQTYAVPVARETISSDSLLSEDDQRQAIAKVNGEVFTLGEYERRLNAQAPFARSRYNALSRKQDFLNNMVRFEVLVDEAERLGYATDPEVVLEVKQAMVRKLLTERVSKAVRIQDIPESELRAWYDAHTSDYVRPEQVRASQIVLKTEAEAKTLLDELQAAFKADPKGARKTFALKAKAVSIDPMTAKLGGDMRFFARHDEGGTVHPAISDAIFAVKQVGELVGPIKSDQGWHIVMLTARKQRQERTFEEAKRSIANRLYREKRAEAEKKLVADLKTKAQIELNDDLLKTLPDPAPPEPGKPAHKHGVGPSDLPHPPKGTPPKPVPPATPPKTPPG